MTHTPGPWYIDPRFATIVRHERDDNDPARRRGPPIANLGLSSNEEVDAANARLVAAAPELLEATRKALAVLHGDEMSKQSLIDAMAACVAAIKKAEFLPKGNPDA